MVNTQFADQINITFNSQSIRGISRILQKLLKYFSDTATLTSFVSAWFVLLATEVLPVILGWNLNDSEFMFSFGSSLVYSQRLFFFFFLHNFFCTLLDYTSSLQKLSPSYYLRGYYICHRCRQLTTHFVNVICLFFCLLVLLLALLLLLLLHVQKFCKSLHKHVYNFIVTDTTSILWS